MSAHRPAHACDPGAAGSLWLPRLQAGAPGDRAPAGGERRAPQQRRVGRLERLEARRAWLVARPELVAALPTDREPVSYEQEQRLVTTRHQMIRAGLYATSSRPTDVFRSVRTLVGELREDNDA